MRTIEKAHEKSRLQCNCMVLNDVVDQRTFGEPLASEIFPPLLDLSYAMIPVVQHLYRALGIDRDGHRIIERNIERPQSVAVETAARAGEGSDDATADFADAAIAQVRKVDCVRTTHGNRPRIAQFGRGGGSPIAGGVPNAITGK